MPFTLSHAVVALPFARTPLPPAAIAVGAMAPDLPLFLRGTPVDYGWTHDPAWIPATVVLAFALLLVWRCLLRPGVRELLPAVVARRLPSTWDAGAVAALRETVAPPARSRVGSVTALVAALALGVASHIAWDAFTHEGRLGVAVLPGLGTAWGPLPGYRWLQYGSSIVGVIILVMWGRLRWRTASVEPVTRVTPMWVSWIVPVALPIVLTAAWYVGLALLGPLSEDFTVRHLAYRALPPACGVWAGLALALAVAVQVTRARRRR